MKNYLTEAFKKLDVLNEDIFELDDEGIAQLKDFEVESENDDTVTVIDPEAEDEADLSDNYVGKVILDCCVCHSKIYKGAEDVKLDDDGELANVDEECPFCYSTDGFKVIGQVAEFKPEEEEEVEVKAEEDGKEAEVDVEVEDKVKNESVSRRGIIDAEADNKKERLKKFIARKRDDIDSDRDYRLKKGITRKDEGKCGEKDCELKEAPIYGLEPAYDSRKSFYGKAQVDTGDDGLSNRLYSYDTLVAEIKNGKPVVYGTFSQTTLRHIKDWLKQLGFKADSSKQIMADYGEKVNESLDSISIDTGDQTIDISAHDKEEEVVEAGTGEETIEPVSADVEAEIVANSESEGDKSEDEVDVDIDEFSEEDFDGLGESYLKKAYNNVESYKTTKASVNGNFLRLEGLITFKSGNQKKTNFIFESKAMTKDGRVKFIGENAQICKGRKAFTVIGKIDSGKFLPESLNYNYKVKDNNTGVSKRVYGTVRTPKH